jgi:hypothetical protein
MANQHTKKLSFMPKRYLKFDERYKSKRSLIFENCMMDILELEKGKELLEMELQLNKLNTDVKKEFIKQNFNSWWKYYFTDEMDVDEDTRLN